MFALSIWWRLNILMVTLRKVHIFHKKNIQAQCVIDVISAARRTWHISKAYFTNVEEADDANKGSS
ncbi:MAG: hypothetical protein CVU51_00065 [Deltaproteobacteria bacterium HGW-Deltaproteobacteria-1]|nr:MAG: hypothetical protein CVU51_00065 [Deltaproteobacteria bacterium HGW-Deltaproteobacteria-1]